MNLKFRPGKKEEYQQILVLHSRVFGRENEARMWQEIIGHETFIPELSLVAETDGRIVGHILFTDVKVMDGENIVHKSLVLALLGVDPKFQGKGLGSELVKFGLVEAQKQGFRSAIVLGPPAFFDKFGFKVCSEYDIRAPFDVEEDFFMVTELQKNGLATLAGIVLYPEPFYNL